MKENRKKIEISCSFGGKTGRFASMLCLGLAFASLGELADASSIFFVSARRDRLAKEEKTTLKLFAKILCRARLAVKNLSNS